MYRRLITLLLLLAGSASRAAAQSPGTSNLYVFPLFADGNAGGASYRSTLRITQPAAVSSMKCLLTQRKTAAPFTGVVGYFYSADVVDAGFSPAAVSQLFLDQFLPFEILRTNGQSQLKTGYAELSCPETVVTDLQVSLFDAQNHKLGEATVSPATQGMSFQFLIDRRDGTRLGFSLVNDSANEGQFLLIARDQFQNEVDRNFNNIIEPWSQVSAFVDQMLNLPADFVGNIELVGLTGGKNYAVGLQYTGTVFTTVQPLVRSTPLPN
jgi:hypothetical protein